MIRVLLADDQSLVTNGLKALLSLEDDLEVVGEARNGEEVLQKINPLQPDIILMDIRMPIMDGVATTKKISKCFPEIKVLVLTTFDDDEYVLRALQFGAKGYLLKDTPTEELARVIRAVHQGYSQLSPGILQKLMSQVKPQLSPQMPKHWEELTPREKEVLKLIATGASNKEIAERLYLSLGTVKNHVTNILRRLDLRDRTQAALFASAWLENDDLN
jgi:DNA-binding NarL/FixJ family response regulator